MHFGYIVISVLFISSLPAHCYELNENQIIEDIKYLSQTSEGIKPSRLRTLLLADLKRALPTVIYSFYFQSLVLQSKEILYLTARFVLHSTLF